MITFIFGLISLYIQKSHWCLDNVHCLRILKIRLVNLPLCNFFSLMMYRSWNNSSNFGHLRLYSNLLYLLTWACIFVSGRFSVRLNRYRSYIVLPVFYTENPQYAGETLLYWHFLLLLWIRKILFENSCMLGI